MKIIRKLFVLFLLSAVFIGIAFLASSCEDLVEKNITDSELILLAPADNLRTVFSTQTFWWEEFYGARTYTLQVVSPSFEAIEIVLADTILTKNKFSLNLFPGKFEWRVKAENGSYSGKYCLRTLQIDSTMDMKGQKVLLTAPGEDTFINTVSTMFKWQKLYNADTYSIEVHKTNWTGDQVFSSEDISYDTISVKTLSEGVFQWGIKAVNRYSATDFTTRKITIDRTFPSMPSLLEPKDKASLLHLPVNLTWNRVTDYGSPITDSLLVSSDSLFATNKIIVSKLILDSKLDDAVQDTGTYFWKVKSVDAAGNQGQFTAKRKFIVLSK